MWVTVPTKDLLRVWTTLINLKKMSWLYSHNILGNHSISSSYTSHQLVTLLPLQGYQLHFHHSISLWHVTCKSEVITIHCKVSMYGFPSQLEVGTTDQSYTILNGRPCTTREKEIGSGIIVCFQTQACDLYASDIVRTNILFDNTVCLKVIYVHKSLYLPHLPFTQIPPPCSLVQALTFTNSLILSTSLSLL